jgi:hypothetical protein
MYGDSNIFSTRITYVKVNIGCQLAGILIGPFTILMTKYVRCNDTQGCYISPRTWLNYCQ